MTAEQGEFAVVVDDGTKKNPCFDIYIGGQVSSSHAARGTAEMVVKKINSAFRARLDAEIKNAVENERLLCADFVRHIHGESTIADELEKRPEVEAAIRKLPLPGGDGK